MKDITVTKLVSGYKLKMSDRLKDDYLKSTLEIKQYLPYSSKVFIATQIVKQSCLDSNGNIHIDSIKKHLMYIHAVIDNYTNITLDTKNMYSEYDMLVQNDILDYIMRSIPDKEREEFNVIIDMVQSDLMTNAYEPHAYITKKFNDILPLLDKHIEPILSLVSNKLKGIDMSKLEEFVNALSDKMKEFENLENSVKE